MAESDLQEWLSQSSLAAKQQQQLQQEKSGTGFDLAALRSSGRRDIWSLVVEHNERLRQSGDVNASSGIEPTVLFLGGRESGKTNAVFRFRNRDKDEHTIERTTALEYSSCRRAKSGVDIEEVAHVWELGGGTKLTSLVDVVLNELNIHIFTAVIVIDLSKPWDALTNLKHFVDCLQKRADQICADLEKRGSKRPKALRDRAAKRIPQDHVDKNIIKPTTIPLIILATKYDKFMDLESERRKQMCRMLRTYAHYYGASLVFSSTGGHAERVFENFRNLVGHYLFAKSPAVPSKKNNLDPTQMMFVAAGSDQFSSIQPPAQDIREMDDAFAKIWREYFPKPKEVVEESQMTPEEWMKTMKKYTEESIDSLRAQKDEELERYRKLLERKARAAAAGMNLTDAPGSRKKSVATVPS